MNRPRFTDPVALRAWVQSWAPLTALYRRAPVALRHRLWRLLSERALRGYRFPRLPPAPPVPAWPASSPSIPSAGINLFGYFRGQFGLAEAARGYARSLLEAGVPVALIDVDTGLLPLSFGSYGLDEHLVQDAPYSTSIVFVNPDYFDAALDAIGRERLKDHRLIGCWFWELERVPDAWLPAIDRVDEVLVASSFVEAAFRRVTEKPIVKVPLPYFSPPDSGAGRVAFGLDDQAFLFLVTLDLHSWVERKNPFAAISAFRAAFPDEAARVTLLIKTSNGLWHPDALNRLVDAAAGDRRVLIRDDILDPAHVRALQRCCDAYVSLHRAEGYGLGLVECMALEKPVIATGWSGNTEFMTTENSCLVNYELVTIPPGHYLHTNGQRWAEPDVEHAAHWMRRLFDDRALAASIGRRAAQDISSRLSSASIGKALEQRLMRGTLSAGRAVLLESTEPNDP